MHDEDEREQAAILRQVLELHPVTLTMDELVREMTGGGTRNFSRFDATQRAVRELAVTGLLHRPGEEEMVHPTRPEIATTYWPGSNDEFPISRCGHRQRTRSLQERRLLQNN